MPSGPDGGPAPESGPLASPDWAPGSSGSEASWVAGFVLPRVVERKVQRENAAGKNLS